MSSTSNRQTAAAHSPGLSENRALIPSSQSQVSTAVLDDSVVSNAFAECYDAVQQLERALGSRPISLFNARLIRALGTRVCGLRCEIIDRDYDIDQPAGGATNVGAQGHKAQNAATVKLAWTTVEVRKAAP